MSSPESQSSTPNETGPRRTTGARRILGSLVVVVGIVFVIGGLIGWFTVKSQLADEQITVSENSENHAGEKVEGPFTAYAQANTVKQDVLDATGGKTFAQLEMDDPIREMALQGASVRSSLMTSTLSFGVSALAAGSGVGFILTGFALVLRNKRD